MAMRSGVFWKHEEAASDAFGATKTNFVRLSEPRQGLMQPLSFPQGGYVN